METKQLTPKQYLEEIKKFRLEIIYLKSTLEDDLYKSPQFQHDKIFSSTGTNSVEENIETLMQKRERTENKIKSLQNEIEHRENIIRAVENEEYKLILYLRYIRGLGWREIEMWLYKNNHPMSDRKIYYIHGKALKKININKK